MNCKKQSFALLEVLIGVSLLSLLSFFFLYQPFISLKEEWQAIKKIEEERGWEEKLLEIEASLPSLASHLPTQPKKDWKRVSFTGRLGKKTWNKEWQYRLWRREKKVGDEHPPYLVYMQVKKTKGESDEKPNYKFVVEKPSN